LRREKRLRGAPSDMEPLPCETEDWFSRPDFPGDSGIPRAFKTCDGL
jgi:hypothetical protein